LQFSDNLTYWRKNSYPIEFQNHAAGFVLSGSGITINGHGTGSINGNGDVWYEDEKGVTRVGRPMVRKPLFLRPTSSSLDLERQSG
jgi:hypothetical protein